LPLEDFGNQLPQITAEVFGLGDLVAAAQGPRYSVLTDAPVSGVIGGEELVDMDRGYVYRGAFGSYIRRFRVSDGHEDGQFLTEGLQAMPGVSPTTGAIFIEPFVGINSTQLAVYEPDGSRRPPVSARRIRERPTASNTSSRMPRSPPSPTKP
jgi:hypothetical protein